MLNEQIGQYRITARLGQGGMGEIFAAHDEKLNRTVAVKFIAGQAMDSESSRRLFLREARAAAALDHPFICTVHDVLEHKGQPMIVMERVEGETLLTRIARGPLPTAEICQVGREIAEALAAAHSRGVIHRDVKSANIMVTPSGHVKVMDFGLAVLLTAPPDEQTAHLSQELRSKVVGTLPYMAPEILRGEHATPSSDLYGVGVVLYEMATGRRPFSGRNDSVLISEILEKEQLAPRQINIALPQALDTLIVRLLDKDPWRRPSAAEVIAELNQAAEPRKRKQRSLAVLPFQSLTSDPENAHLGVALADATTSELALVHSLLVRPTATILRYQDRTVDPIAAGRELGVDAVVAGTYQRAGSRLRVSVQLINTVEERPLWSTKVDTTLDDIFALQDEVSRKIVDALQLELTPADEQRMAKRQQPVGDVLDLCLKGRAALLESESAGKVNEAIEHFEQARDLDPSNPLPWAGLSDAYSRLAFTWDPDAGWHERAKEMADRALQIDPDLPEGRYLRGRLAWTPQGHFDHEYAMTEISAAIAERPNMSEAYDWLATILFHVGLVEESEQQFARALTINPDDGIALSHVPTCHMLKGLKGEYAEAIRSVGLAIPKHGSPWVMATLALAQLHVDDVAGAEKTLESAARKFPGVVLIHSVRAVLAAFKGNATVAEQQIAWTVKNQKSVGHYHHAEFDIACALALLGRIDEALDALHSAIHNGYPCYPAVVNEPFLSSLHSHPRYVAIVADLKLQLEHYREVWSKLQRTISTA